MPIFVTGGGGAQIACGIRLICHSKVLPFSSTQAYVHIINFDETDIQDDTVIRHHTCSEYGKHMGLCFIEAGCRLSQQETI
jgi:hypothetical protein